MGRTGAGPAAGPRGQGEAGRGPSLGKDLLVGFPRDALDVEHGVPSSPVFWGPGPKAEESRQSRRSAWGTRFVPFFHRLVGLSGRELRVGEAVTPPGSVGLSL